MEALATATSADGVNELSIDSILGRKGRITHFLRNISSLPVEERPQAGKSAPTRSNGPWKMNSKMRWIAWPGQPKRSPIALTYPCRGECRKRARFIRLLKSPIAFAIFFSQMGFDVVEGPEVETDYYNFEALNIPKNRSGA